MRMRVPDNILNKELYVKARKIADKVHERHSAYKSMYISKKYKELGGKYKTEINKVTKSKGGVTRWNKERWIQVIPYLKNKTIIECGSLKPGTKVKDNKVCRPLVRVTKDTPITINELIELIGKQDMLKLAIKKKNDMDGRVFWKTKKFYPSKK